MRSATDDVETAVTERTQRQWRPSPRVTFAISAAFALVSTALLILNLWVAHRRHAYTSDDVGLQTILHTWRPWNSSVAHVGEDTFVLKIPLYALAAVGFSPTRTTIFLTSVVMNLAGLALLGLAARFFLRRMPPSRHGFAHPIGISALWFVAIGGLVDLLLRPNIRNVELGLGLFALTSVVRLHDEWPSLARRAAYTRLATASVVLGLLFYDDPYFVFMLLPPVIVVFGARWLGGARGNNGTDHIPMVASAGGIIVWRLCIGLGHVLGFEPSPRPPRIVPLAQIWTALSTAVTDVLNLADANVFGQPSLERHTLETAVHLAVLLSAVGLGGAVLWRRRARDPWYAVLALLPATCLLVYAATDKALTPGNSRYVVLVLPEALILLAMVLRSLNTRETAALCIVVALSIGGSVRDTVNTIRTPVVDNPNARELQIIDAVRDRGLGRGYGDFWDANIVTYLSSFDIDLVPVGCAEGRTASYVWFVDSNRFAPRADRSFFVTTDHPNRSTCPTDQVVAQFGSPIDRIQLSGTREVLIFDHDIGEDIHDELR